MSEENPVTHETTANYNLRYPTDAAPVDTAGDFKQLAEDTDAALEDKASSQELTDGLKDKSDTGHSHNDIYVPKSGGSFTVNVTVPARFQVSAANGGNGGAEYPYNAAHPLAIKHWGFSPDTTPTQIYYYKNWSSSRYTIGSAAGRSVPEAKSIIESQTLMTYQARLINPDGELDEEPEVYVDSVKTIEHLADIVEAQTNVIAALTDAGRKSAEAASAVAELQALMNKDTHEIVPDAEPLEADDA